MKFEICLFPSLSNDCRRDGDKSIIGNMRNEKILFEKIETNPISYQTFNGHSKRMNKILIDRHHPRHGHDEQCLLVVWSLF